MINFTYRNIGIFYSSLAERDIIFNYINKQTQLGIKNDGYIKIRKCSSMIEMVYPNIKITFVPLSNTARGYSFDEAYISEFSAKYEDVLIAEMAVLHTNGTLYVIKEFSDRIPSYRVNYYNYIKEQEL